jgi:hypothetical protein
LPTGERFIELYNPNNQNIDLTDWYIQRKTETGTSWNSLVSSTKFAGKSIQQQSYFLIARTATLNPDILLENLTLSENNVISLKNPNQEIVDKVGWGQAQDFEGAPVANPQSGESLGRKWIGGQGYQDTDNNSNDFEIQTPTPKTQNSQLPSPSSSPSPSPSESPSPSPSPVPQPVMSLTNYRVNSPNFIVNWSAEGASGYDIQVKVGDGDWLNLLPLATTQTSYDYSASQDFTLYKFRSRSKDASNNLSDWAEIEAGYATMPVIINEVMYNPSAGDNSHYEYVELYNPCPFDIDLKGWILISDGEPYGQAQILDADTTHGGSSTVIKAGGYALVNDKAAADANIYDNLYYQVPAYSASAIRLQIDDDSLGLPSNKYQTWVSLKDKNNNLIDKSYYSNDWNWAQGDGKSLEKFRPLSFSDVQNNWSVGQVGGTPNQQNSNYSATASNYLPANYSINGATTFSPTFGPYMVDISLKVEAGATLTIRPGTIIKFKQSYYASDKGRLIIHGTVLAQGSESEPIVFTSAADSASDFKQAATNGPAYPGDWYYIEVSSDSQGTIFDHVIVRYGGVAIPETPEKGAFRILAAGTIIKNSLFDNNWVAGIYLGNNVTNVSLENLVLRNHTSAYYSGSNPDTPSVALWFPNVLPAMNNIEITGNACGVYWPAGGGTCQAIIDNQTVVFSQNIHKMSCGCCPF